MYDAYVIYADEDFPFVREMMTQLEDNFGVRLCIANRDMLAGAAQFQATAAMIRRRCVNVLDSIVINTNTSYLSYLKHSLD